MNPAPRIRRVWVFAVCLVLGPALLPAWAEAPAAEKDFALAPLLEAFVVEQLGEHPTEIRIPPLPHFKLPGLAAADADVELRLDGKREFAGSVPITAVVRRDGRVLRRGVVTVQVETRAPIWITRRPLGRGEEIRADDLEQVEADQRSLRGARVLTPAEMVGRRTRRAVGAGKPLRAHWVEEVPLVHRGKRVRLLFQSGSLRIEAAGEAKEDGGIGDHVRVRNLESRRDLVGEVGADGAVHVAF